MFMQSMIKPYYTLQKAICLLSLLFVAGLSATAQNSRYIIRLTDKQNNPFSIDRPWEYLSAKALQNRIKNNVPIDSTDLPVTPRYLDSIRLAGAVTILNTSKWLNQVAIKTTDAAAISKINSFPFVVSAQAVAPFTGSNFSMQDKFEKQSPVEPENSFAPHVLPQNITGYYDYGKSNGQIKIHQGDFLHNHGFHGEGMQMAVVDAGFENYLTFSTFDSVRMNNQILGTWDFVDNEASVNEDFFHGMICLSAIAANLPGTFVGTAPKTSFYLFRSEDADTEYIIEEQNYAAALERADSLGVEISSTSLGYNTYQNGIGDHTYSDMNGDITIAARAADFAAHKGMLLVVALGNAGGTSWNFLLTPADADSVLSVGAVDTLGNVASFSSYGPSSDGQIKPGVAAVGWRAVAADLDTGAPTYWNGTSLACPNMAGLATCLWQAFPEANNMGIISALQESANRFTNPDNRTGYGIPDMKKAFVILLKRFYMQTIRQAGCNTFINFDIKLADGMDVEIERKLPTDADFISIQTYNGSGSFAKTVFNFSDDLSGYVTPVSIDYRIKMTIAGDTSFYFNPVTVNHVNACNTYTFTGNGNWTDQANWSGNIMPPPVLPAGSTIIIDPATNGECILNVNEEISAGAFFNVLAYKKLTVTGNLNIAQ